MVQRLALAKFRFAIAEVVRKAEHGETTILTHYNRAVAAVVPITMLPQSEKEGPVPETPSEEDIRTL